MPGPYRGSCLCGRIRFEADRFDDRIAHCHCSMCRKFHGAAYATIAGVRREDFRWLTGEDALVDYRADNGTTRRFCQDCGSSLIFASDQADPNIIEVALGGFDDPLPVSPDAHIYVESGAKWATPDDDLPCYAEGRDGRRLR